MDLTEILREKMLNDVNSAFEDTLKDKLSFAITDARAKAEHKALQQAGFVLSSLCVSAVMCILTEEAEKRGIIKDG